MRVKWSIGLLIFGVCLHEEFCIGNKICSGEQYTVKNANGTIEKCQSCGVCNEGYGLEPKCGSTVISPVKNTYCKPCRNGTFSSKYDSSPCHECQHCAKHEIETASCTKESNTNCSGTCEQGYYFSAKDASHACHECFHCCSDGLDEIQVECVKHGLVARHCSPRADKNCGPTVKPSASSSERGSGQSYLYIVYIALGVLAGGISIIVVRLLWKRRRNDRQDQDALGGVQYRDEEDPQEDQTPMIMIVTEHTDHAGLSDLKNGNVSTQHGAGLSDPAATPNVHSHRHNVAFVPSNPATPRVTPSGTPDLNRPLSGQFKIVQHPRSQNRKEGSRVEFTCGCQAAGTQVSYQWYKDEEELQGQSSHTLVLDSVRMRDFGCYRCHVTREGDASEIVKSSPAVLDVTPLPGKRLKLLQELKPETRDEVAKRLEVETTGTGGWRVIAYQNDMKDYEIQRLRNVQEPGKEVMDFLQASKPNLTVYSFCKTLKGDNMKRFDIAKVLEGDLVIQGARTL